MHPPNLLLCVVHPLGSAGQEVSAPTVDSPGVAAGPVGLGVVGARVGAGVGTTGAGVGTGDGGIATKWRKGTIFQHVYKSGKFRQAWVVRTLGPETGTLTYQEAHTRTVKGAGQRAAKSWPTDVVLWLSVRGT